MVQRKRRFLKMKTIAPFPKNQVFALASARTEGAPKGAVQSPPPPPPPPKSRSRSNSGLPAFAFRLLKSALFKKRLSLSTDLSAAPLEVPLEVPMETPLEGPQAVSVSGGGALAGKAAACSATRQLTPRCAETGRRFAAMRSAEVRSAAGRASEIRSAAGRASEIRSACNRPKSKEAGFSITGVLVSSSIGLIVLTGTMQTLVNISHRLSVQEARLKQPLLHSYLIERFAKTGRCTKTLEGLKITENAAVTLDSGVKEYWANPTTAPRQHVASLKDAAGTVLRDLHSAQTQKDFKRDFDIDKFARLIFRGFHPEGDSGTPAVDFDDPGDTEEGRARLEAFVMDKGMFRKPIIVQLRGVKLKKDGHGTGIHKITACHSVDSVADHSAEIAALKARIKALEDWKTAVRLSVNSSGDLESGRTFVTASGKHIATQGNGDIFTKGGNIYTTGSGYITTSGGDIFTQSGGDLYTQGAQGHIHTRSGGSIWTTGAGFITTRGSGDINTHGGSIWTRSGGDIYTQGAQGAYHHKRRGYLYKGRGRPLHGRRRRKYLDNQRTY